MNDLKETIKQYLKEVKLMQLATVNQGSPWVCTVNYVVDEEMNLFWMSLRSTRHSVELVNDPRTAIAVVVDQTNKRGIQMQGNANEVKGEELNRIHKLYCERYGDKKERLVEAQSGKSDVRAYYKFVPKTVMLFDESSTNVSQSLDLS